MKRRMELGEEGGENLDDGDESAVTMKIVSVTPHVNADASNRRTTESIQVVYELETDFSEGRIEVVSASSVIEQYPLPSLKRGRHTMTIPGGLPVANQEYTFTCNLEGSNYGGITLLADNLWDNRKIDSSSTNCPPEKDESVYEYKPGPQPEEPKDPPPDEAPAFRGEEMASVRLSFRRSETGRAAVWESRWKCKFGEWDSRRETPWFARNR